MADIILGSGKLYMLAYDAEDGIPTNEALEVAGNEIGTVKGGASVTYKPTTYSVTDDFGRILKSFVTSEEVTLKSGVITFDMQVLANLSGAAAYSATTTAKTVKIGGRGANGLQAYIIRFVHTMASGLKLRCTIVGSNEEGLSFAFAPDKETQIDVTWKAMPSDTDGTLVIFEEELAGA